MEESPQMSAMVVTPDMASHEPASLRPYSPEWYENLVRTLGETACRQMRLFAIDPQLLLSVVIPVYNEKDTLVELIRRVCAVPIRKEIILVEDCSKDGTRDLVKQLEARGDQDPQNVIRAVYHEQNRGKGAGLRSGFAAAKGDIIIIQDADHEYDPGEYPRLLQPVIDGVADVVFGSRFLGDRPHRVLYYWHYLGNTVLTQLSNCFTNLNLTDMETCYKVFRRDVLLDILPKLQQDRFGFEPEVTARLARRRYRVYEVSCSYDGRTYEEGKKIGWRDGVKAIWCIVRYGLWD